MQVDRGDLRVGVPPLKPPELAATHRGLPAACHVAAGDEGAFLISRPAVRSLPGRSGSRRAHNQHHQDNEASDSASHQGSFGVTGPLLDPYFGCSPPSGASGREGPVRRHALDDGPATLFNDGFASKLPSRQARSSVTTSSAYRSPSTLGAAGLRNPSSRPNLRLCRFRRVQGRRGGVIRRCRVHEASGGPAPSSSCRDQEPSNCPSRYRTSRSSLLAKRRDVESMYDAVVSCRRVQRRKSEQRCRSRNRPHTPHIPHAS